MANTIRLKRGTSIPLAADLVTGELAVNTTNGAVYTKTDAGAVVQVGTLGGGGGGVWGTITGDLVNQTDLALALANKYDGNNPNGYIQEANTDGNYYVRRSGLWETLPSAIIGPPGPTGPAGSPWVYRGAYDNGVTYDANDYVTLNGSSYVFINFIGGAGYDPIGYPAAWQLVASKGDTGAAGTPADLSAYAPKESPVFTGDPQGPTAALGDSDTSLANTAFVQQELASGVAISKSVVATVRNETGATLTKGTVVYISGAASNKALVSKAQANAESTSASTYGIVQADIAHNNNGTVVISGIITGLDTLAFTAGVPLYLSPTEAGGLTSTKPTAPNHMVSIGVVTYQHANQGAIQLRVVNGFELEELHNVAITTPADKNLLAYESTTSLYKNKTAADLGIAELSGATFTNKVNFTPASGAAGLNIGIGGVQATANVAGDVWIATAGTVLNYRDATGAARIVAARNLANTFSNAQTISVGDTNNALRIIQTGAGNAFVVEDGSSTNPDTDSFVINNAGNVGIGVNPNTWTATEKLEVNGNIKFSDGTVQSTAANATFVDARAASVVRGTVSVSTSSSYTLTNYGPNQVIKQDTNGSSTSVITVPANANVPIPVGSQFVLIQSNQDPFVITTESGVSVAVAGNRYKSNGLYSVCTLIKTDTNEWYLAGDLTTA